MCQCVRYNKFSVLSFIHWIETLANKTVALNVDVSARAHAHTRTHTHASSTNREKIWNNANTFALINVVFFSIHQNEISFDDDYRAGTLCIQMRKHTKLLILLLPFFRRRRFLNRTFFISIHIYTVSTSTFTTVVEVRQRYFPNKSLWTWMISVLILILLLYMAFCKIYFGLIWTVESDTAVNFCCFWPCNA